MDILHNAIKMLDEVDFGNVGEEKDELITAKAREDGVRGQHILKNMGCLFEHMVTKKMTIGVVYLLKKVQIYQNKSAGVEGVLG